MSDEGPSWLGLNHKLRKGQAFDKEEQVFFDEILFALHKTPQVKGLVFRGHALSAEDFNKLKIGKAWNQKAFTSTSISFGVARSFGSKDPRHGRSGVLIIKTKGGSPMSPLTFDNGYRGEPGRVEEREVLLAPGAKLYVTQKIEDPAKNMNFVFAEER